MTDLLEELKKRKEAAALPKVEFTEEFVDDFGDEEVEEAEAIVPPTPMMTADDPAPEMPPEVSSEGGAGAILSEDLPEISIDRDLFIKILEWTIDHQIDKTQVELIVEQVGRLVEERQKILTMADLTDVMDIPELQEKKSEPEAPAKEEEIAVRPLDPFREGATATNPTTGEKVIFLSGKWEPYKSCNESE
jgi:hypothetical protein